MKYERRLIAFIDILGFTALVKESENNPIVLEKINGALEILKESAKPSGWSLSTIEIEESAQYKGIENFKIDDKINVTCFSDSIVASVNLEIINLNEALSTFIANLALMGAYLLSEGILIRGGITDGNLIHTRDSTVFGQALIDAYKIESELSVYPRILLTKKLINHLQYPILTKKDEYPYHRYLCRFEDGCVGFDQLVFFEVFQSTIDINIGTFKETIGKIKQVIINGLDSCFDNPNVYKKYEWLKCRYNSLILLGDKKQDQIRDLNEGIYGKNIHFSYTDDFYYKKGCST